MDEKLELTRRKALTGLGGIGAGAALGGTGTMAFLNDTETSEGNTVTAGELDLEIDWEEHYNGELIEEQALTSNPGPIFELGDVKPGDYGEATISLHVFDNPAWVHMAGELTKNAEKGVNEPESKAAGEDDDYGEESGDDWSGELADEILVDVWYDGTDEEEDGGNNEKELNEELIVSGTLTEVLDYLESGVLLEDQTGPAPTALSSGATTQSTDVTAEFCGQFSQGPQTQQCIACVPCADPEPLLAVEGLSGFEYEPEEIPDTATHVTLKAANGCYVAALEADTQTISMPDELPEDAENNQYGQISNATFYRCPDDNGNGDNGNGDNGNGDNGNGENGNGGNGDCWPNSTTQYIGFSWELPFEVGNEIQSDQVKFDLEFHAQQCRHNDDPENPYTDD